MLKPEEEEDTEEEDGEDQTRPVKLQARAADARSRAGSGLGDMLRELEEGRADDAYKGVQVKSDGTARYCRKVCRGCFQTRCVRPLMLWPPSSAPTSSPTERITARPAVAACSRWTSEFFFLLE